jgi:DNA-binding response OmpR family regulator
MAIVAVVEDDQTQADIVGTVLESAGHQARTFRTALEFRRGLGRAAVDAVVLDWMLPDEPGVDVLRWLRASAYAGLPVLMLTMLDREDDVLTAFDAGADDYLVKPASPPILLARIASQLRRNGAAENLGPLRLGRYAIDGRRRTLSIGDAAIDLTEKEFDLAHCLFRRPNLMVSRDLILREVWQVHKGIETRSLDTYLSRLRKRLGLDGTHGWRLRTIYQHGYRLESCADSDVDERACR